MSDGGKGSKPRPLSVSQQEWENRWDAIFGRDNLDAETSKPTQDSTETQESLENNMPLV